MTTLLKTTNKKEADKFQAEAQKKYGGMAVYRFQYRSNDGNFYYEILLNSLWIGEGV